MKLRWWMVGCAIAASLPLLATGCNQPPPQATGPEQLEARYDPADGAITLTWQAPTGSGPAPAEYRVYRVPHDWADAPPTVPIAAVPGSETEYVDQEAEAGQRWTYIVESWTAEASAASGAAGVVARTEIDDTPPAPPVIDAEETGDYERDAGGAAVVVFDLSPDDLHGAEDVVAYNVYRSESPDAGPGAGAERLTSLTAKSQLHVDRTVRDGVDYYYWVTATDGSNESAPSAASPAVRPSANPQERALSVLKSVLAIALTLGIAIAIHEFGHMSVAKLFGIAVDEFAIGFGRKVWETRRGETDYSLRIFPVGGFVRIRGMLPDEVHDPRGIYSRPAYARAAIMLAGAVMNVILAFCLYAVVAGAFTTGTRPVVEKVKPGGPAEAAGIERGDVIVSVNGRTYGRDIFAVGAIARNPGKELRLGILRDGEEFTVRVVPESAAVGKGQDVALYGLGGAKSRGMIGIVMRGEGDEAPRTANPIEMARVAARHVVEDSGILLRLLRDLVLKRVGVEGSLGGPIMIAQSIHQAQVAGPKYLLDLIANLNITLGVINLLPIPMVDGSRIILTLIEGARGRIFDKEKEAMFHFVGAVALFVFALFISVLDVRRLTGGM